MIADLISQYLPWLSGIVTFLFVASETLGSVKFFKANSIFQLVAGVLGWVKNLVVGKG